MALQKTNADIMVNAVLTGAITEDMYISLSTQAGVEEAQARTNLAALLKEVEEARVKEALKGFKDETLVKFMELGNTIALPEGVETCIIGIAIDLATGVTVEKFQVKKADGERFLNLSRKSGLTGTANGGKPNIPVPTIFIDAGMKTWTDVCQALNPDVKLGGRSAWREFGRQCGEPAKKLAKALQEGVQNLPATDTDEQKLAYVDSVVEASGFTL